MLERTRGEDTTGVGMGGKCPQSPAPRPHLPAHTPFGWLVGLLTVEPAPAADVAGCLIGQNVARRREAGELHGVSQLGTARELDEGDVIAGEEGGVVGNLLLQPDKPHLPAFAPDVAPLGCPHCPFPLQILLILWLGNYRKPSRPHQPTSILSLHKRPQLSHQEFLYHSCIRTTGGFVKT